MENPRHWRRCFSDFPLAWIYHNFLERSYLTMTIHFRKGMVQLMNNSTTNIVYLHDKNNSNNTTITIPQTSAITTSVTGNNYCLTLQESAVEYCLQTESTISLELLTTFWESYCPKSHRIHIVKLEMVAIGELFTFIPSMKNIGTWFEKS